MQAAVTHFMNELGSLSDMATSGAYGVVYEYHVREYFHVQRANGKSPSENKKYQTD